MGSMKLTEAPPSTQSMRTSLKPWISRSPSVVKALTLMLLSICARMSYSIDSRDGLVESIDERHGDTVLCGLAQGIAERLVDFEWASSLEVLQRGHAMTRCA